jgi:transcription elongation factor GreA
MNTQAIQITDDGLKKLQEELRELIEVKRPKVVDRLSTARAMGDLSENNDYSQAKDELSFVDGRIAELEDVVRNAVVVAKQGNDQVVLGSQVVVKNSGEHVFHVVGEWEADPMKKMISHKSPLGMALMGKKVGDTAEVEAPVGKIIYKILSIE